MRLENRGRVKPGDPAPGPGVLRRVLVSGITGDKNGPRGSYLMGIPEQPIRDIMFSGAVHVAREVPETKTRQPSVPASISTERPLGVIPVGPSNGSVDSWRR